MRRRFNQGNSGKGNSFLRISGEVTDAVASGKPVVALETTIYTHGRLCFATVADYA